MLSARNHCAILYKKIPIPVENDQNKYYGCREFIDIQRLERREEEPTITYFEELFLVAGVPFTER